MGEKLSTLVKREVFREVLVVMVISAIGGVIFTLLFGG